MTDRLFANDPTLVLSEGLEIDVFADRSPSETVNSILVTAVDRRATDIHIETFNRHVRLRFRIDGLLEVVNAPFDSDSVSKIVARLKVLSGLDMVEHHHDLDGHFGCYYEEAQGSLRKVDFRVSIIPGPYGEDASVRVLDPSRFILDLDQLVPSERVARDYKSLIHYPAGLILVTGPTSSGKTTTLYASIETLAHENRKIVTVEDPIEYEFPGVNQMNVTSHMGFADYLRAILRQNPDVILVGEIRDEETAEIAIRAATTGHLIFSTIHSSDSIAAIGRLRTLGVPDDYISNVVLGIMGQRLLRRICKNCRQAHDPNDELLRMYDVPSGASFFHGAGCDACGGKGYHGLVGVFDLLRVDDEIASQIAHGVGVHALRQAALANGHRTLVDDALGRAQAGETTLEEVARKVPPLLH